MSQVSQRSWSANTYPWHIFSFRCPRPRRFNERLDDGHLSIQLAPERHGLTPFPQLKTTHVPARTLRYSMRRLGDGHTHPATERHVTG